jgi:hypothetical protein
LSQPAAPLPLLSGTHPSPLSLVTIPPRPQHKIVPLFIVIFLLFIEREKLLLSQEHYKSSNEYKNMTKLEKDTHFCMVLLRSNI